MMMISYLKFSVEEIKILIRIATVILALYIYGIVWAKVLNSDLDFKDNDDVRDKIFKVLGILFLMIHLIAFIAVIIWAWI